jgi:hypothetical protein
MKYIFVTAKSYQDPDLDAHGSALVWLRIEIKIWIRIGFNADPQHWFCIFSVGIGHLLNPFM